MTTTVKPTALVQLDHGAYWTSIATTRFGFCVCAYKDQVSYIDEQFRSHQIPGKWSGRLYGSSILPSNDPDEDVRIAIRHSNRLTVVDLEGNILFQCSAPEGANYFGDSLFDPHRNELWLSTTLSRDQFEIQILDTNSWQVVAQRVIDDPMSDHSGQTFHHTYQPGIVGLDLTTGGCGEAFLILNRENGISFENGDISEGRYTVFSPDDKEFLVNEGHSAIVRYGYPEIGPYDYTDNLDEALSEYSGEDSSVGSSIAYLDSSRALISDDDSILGVLNLSSMKLQGTVKVKLDDDACSWSNDPNLANKSMNWTTFCRVHDQIVFVQRHGFDKEATAWIWIVPVAQLV